MNKSQKPINYVMWCTYHDKKLLKEYNLKESEHFKLYYTKDINNDVKYSLNYAQLYINEYSTQYYVWKNNIKSDLVGFCHYRRIYNSIINDDLINYIYNNSSYYTFLNYSLKHINLIEDWKYSGLEIHLDLLTKYVSEYYPKFYSDRLEKIFNSVFYIQNYGELYLCKWKIFDELMKFIEGYIKFLFKNVLNIEKDELIEYSEEEIKMLDESLNNINHDLFKKYHKSINSNISNIGFFGSPRTIAFTVEMIIGIFWELFYSNINY